MTELSLDTSYQKEIDSGMVSCRKHPVDDLWILNYTPECQFSKSWNDVTLQCRGLIVDKSGRVVARPFRKFFNLTEHDNPELPKVPHGSPFHAYEKMDGSLGISYFSSRGWEIATRGSFESEQAIFATKLLHTKYSHIVPNLNPNWTYLFEIIYPENRIVVDYGKEEELVLLGVVMTQNGHEIPLEPLFKDLGFKLPRRFDVSEIESLPRDTQNFEGYVIRFENGLRVKVKLEDYIRLHKLMTGITPNRIWELLSSGQDVENIIRELPDEMYNEVMEEVDIQRSHHASLLYLHVIMLKSLNLDNKTRKEQAQIILEDCKRSQNEAIENLNGMIIPLNSAILFLLLDGQKEMAKKKAWNLVKPKNGNVLICKSDILG